MSGMRGKLAELTIMYALAASSNNVYKTTEREIDLIPIKTIPIPKGCKEYFFNERGYYSTEQMRKSEIVFKCVASNDKTAKKKFAAWQAANPN